MDTCGEPGIDSSRALAAVKRRENQLIDASARHDAKVSALRERLSAANAKISEMARLAEETRLNVDAITGVGGWRPIETAPKGELLIGYVGDAVRLIYWGKTSHVPLYGWNLADQGVEDCELCQPSHWMPLPQPPKEADDDDA